MTGMRGVIGRDRIHRAVPQRHHQRLDVSRRAQRRIHLAVRVVIVDRLVREREMMRRDFARDPRPAALPAPHCFQRIGGRKMRHMQASIRNLLRKLDIPVHNTRLRRSLPPAQSQAERCGAIVHRTIFRQPRVFRMLHHRKTQLSAQPQALAHDVVVENWPPVIGHRHRPRALQPAKIREHSAFAGMGRGRHRKHIDHRAAFRLAQPVHPLLRVDRRRRIWHAAHRRETPRRRCRRSRRNCLFVGLPRFPQMDMQVNKPRGNDQPPRIKFLLRPTPNLVRRRHFGHPPVAQHDIHRRINTRGRIDHMSASDQQRSRFGFLAHFWNQAIGSSL